MVAFRPQRSWSASDKVKVRRAALTESSIRRTRVSPAGPFRHRAATIRCAPGRASHPWCAARLDRCRRPAYDSSWLSRSDGTGIEQVHPCSRHCATGTHWKPVACQALAKRRCRIAREGPALTSTLDTGRQLGGLASPKLFGFIAHTVTNPLEHQGPAALAPPCRDDAA